MDFPTSAEMPDGTQAFLLKLRDSKLEDDMLLEEFYDRIIESFHYGENYYIILIHGTYDIPGKASDGSELYDASENVYEHILCSICPVNMSKAALAYNEEHNTIENRIRDWVVEPPMRDFCSLLFSTGVPTFITCLPMPKTRRTSSPTIWSMFWALLSR